MKVRNSPSVMSLQKEVDLLKRDIHFLTALMFRSSVQLAVLEYANATTNFTYVPTRTCTAKSGVGLNIRSEEPSIFKIPSLEALYHQDMVRESAQSFVP